MMFVFEETKVVANRPTASEQSAAPLAERIRAGDAAAERELVEEYSRGLKVILRHVGADAFAVDDLHQETFRIALGKIRAGELRDAARLSGFIASLARNLATDYFRRGTRSATSDSAALESVQSLEALALDRIAASEQARRVRQVLAELRTERDREILRRFYL
ncbi:MAG TPA: sigma-70 family RNA polymerase sigma factor, partial [Myxococcaceae bacterium]|nr:sigma-70 family RNA polymerase sigma factor [Myxococcaceae bacterium]